MFYLLTYFTTSACTPAYINMTVLGTDGWMKCMPLTDSWPNIQAAYIHCNRVTAATSHQTTLGECLSPMD